MSGIHSNADGFMTITVASVGSFAATVCLPLFVIALAVWSAAVDRPLRVTRVLANVFLLFLSLGVPIGLAIYFGLRRTEARLARSALGVQLVGTPLVFMLLITGG